MISINKLYFRQSDRKYRGPGGLEIRLPNKQQIWKFFMEGIVDPEQGTTENVQRCRAISGSIAAF